MLSLSVVVACLTCSTSAIRISVQEVAYGGGKARSGPGHLGCRDPSGSAVDFWYAFKYPGNWEYAYMDQTHKLKTMPGNMGDGKSPVDRTLDQLYQSKGDLSYALWNDEPTNSGNVGAPKAHSKGVFAFAKSAGGGGNGFWLIHSVPTFPQAPEHVDSSKSSFPGAKTPTYGQSFLCITIGSDAIDTLMKVFETNWNVIYAAADNAGLGGEFAEWATKGKHVNPKDQSAASVVATVKSLGGQAFIAFGKSAALADDLYEALVAPHFQKDFYTETWQNGVGKIPSWKKGKEHKYTIENNDTVDFPGHDSWTESKDHSKWAVSMDGQVFCVGDINRQVGQTKRGGGTTCITDESLASQILNVIVKDEDGDTPDHHQAMDVDADEDRSGKKRKANNNDATNSGDSGDTGRKRRRKGDPVDATEEGGNTMDVDSTEEDGNAMDVDEDEPIAKRTRAQTNGAI